MKQYQSPELHFAHIPGGLSGSQLAQMSDDELAELLQTASFARERAKYQIKPGYVLRTIAGEAAIVPVSGEGVLANALMSPNDTGAFLWNAFQQPRTIQDVVVQGLEEYDVSQETLRSTVEQFVQQSMELNVLEEVE